jgi:hypothetical protein
MGFEQLKLEPVPEYDVLDEVSLRAVLQSGQRLLDTVCESRGTEGSWSFCESVWPAMEVASKAQNGGLQIVPRLVLLPLSRIGAEGGFSGSRILLAYFSDEGPDKLFPSLPFVVKLALREEPESKVVEEKRLADRVRPYLAYNKSAFAIPLFLDHDQNGFDVLWSPFALTERVAWSAATSRLSLSSQDLRTALRRSERRIDAVVELVESTFKMLEPLHRRARTTSRSARRFGKEYSRYLRGFRSKWGQEWLNAWGTEPVTSDLGRDGLYNPIWVLEQLESTSEFKLLTGAVHGDLHPGNILYSQAQTPSIIDFGWADDDAHVAKDFALLECNLRFVYLPADLPFEDIKGLSSWIAFDQSAPTFDDETCNGFALAISKIRERYRQIGDEAMDWDLEYVVPLFFVAFGLLRFLDQYWNQLAARMFVLELAEYLAKRVLPRVTSGGHDGRAENAGLDVT